MKKDERLNFSDRTPSVRRLVVSLVLMLLAALPAAAQNKKITVDLDNVPVREFIKTVESQSGYTFAYNNSEIDLTRRVSVKAADENVVDVVIRALSAQNLTARMEGSRIVVSRKPAAARVQTAQPVRGGVVTGTVKTISGEPVIGASVIVLETNRGNVTGLEGDFSVEATPGQTLSVSFLGYNTQQIKVGSQTSFDITLTEDSKQISEVLVVGYTPMRKSDFTGSIASVKASELSATTPTVGQSLVGKVAGVEVHQTSGAPGDGVTIRVRGVNSLSASSAPLYVIDGYPASEDVFINPNDIESIDILKDAASAAIYGSRGASGVVLITTKRGKDGEAAKVSYDFSYGIQQLDHKVDLLNSTQFRDLLIDARNNSYRLRATAAGVSWSPYDDNTIRAAKGFSLAEVGIHPMCYDFTTRTPVTPQYDTDWQDELFSNAGIMRHNVSVIGGTKAIKYMASVGYMDQDGIIAPSNHNPHQRPHQPRRPDHQAPDGEHQLLDVRRQEHRRTGRGPHDQRRRDPERADVPAQPAGLRGKRRLRPQRHDPHEDGLGHELPRKPAGDRQRAGHQREDVAPQPQSQSGLRVSPRPQALGPARPAVVQLPLFLLPPDEHRPRCRPRLQRGAALVEHRPHDLDLRRGPSGRVHAQL